MITKIHFDFGFKATIMHANECNRNILLTLITENFNNNKNHINQLKNLQRDET